MDGVAAIAVATEMGEEYLAPTRIFDGLEQCASGAIGKVTMASADSLLDRPGPFFVALQELWAVVRFYDQGIDILYTVSDMLGSESEVR